MTNHVLGVDISKASLDVHLAPTGETQQFANSTEGFRRLIAWLRDRPVSRVVYEPTGPWHRGECQKVWGSAGFVRIYGHMIHRRPTDTAVAIGCLYRDRREGYRHGGRQAVRKRQQCPPRTVDRAGHPRPRHALPDCPTLFGTLESEDKGGESMIREAYADAAAFFVETVAQIGSDAWSRPALGEWTVRDLVGHTHRALVTVETYLDIPAEAAEMTRPVDYYLRAGASLADPAKVAARGRAAGEALAADPSSAVRAAALRVLDLVARKADDALLATPVGGIRLIDYLPSRVLELTVHTADIAAALNLDGEAPLSAVSVSLHLMADLAVECGYATPLLGSLTGRHPLPPAFNVLPV